MAATRRWISPALLLTSLMVSSACLDESPRDEPPADRVEPGSDPAAPVEPSALIAAGPARWAVPDPGSASVVVPPAPAEEPAVAVDVLVPRFETALSGTDDFFRMPWPSDYRRTGDGRIDLSDFPNRSNHVVDGFLDTIEADVAGFSQMPVVYVVLDGAPENLTLPTPPQTFEADSPAQLIDLTPGHCGARTPLEMVFSADGDTYRADDLLSVAPAVGFPLAPATTYAFLLFEGFGKADGLEAVASPEMAALLEGDHPDARLEEVYGPLWDCLDELAIPRDEVALATVFTTQDPVAETRRLRDMVVDPQRVPAPVVRDWAPVEVGADAPFVTWSGVYETPIFERGESPYTNSGGGVVLDASGEPIIQRWEAVPFVISWPRTGEASYPVLVWEDGTGASLLHHLREELALELFEAGFAIASFAPQFHDARAVPGSDPVLHSFNYLNPEAGRTVFRQQVVDTAYFVRVLREAMPDVLEQPVLDTARLVYGGHSQGALVGALLAGVETEFVAYYLNGSGSYISETVVGRKDPIDIAATLSAFAQIDGEVTVYHPLVQMTQMAADTVDSYCYARYWAGWEGHPGGSNVFMTNGFLDHTTPHRLISHLTIAGDLAPIAPVGWEVDPYGLWSRQAEPLPLEGNRRALDGSPLTMASYLNAETGHYTVYDDPFARALAVGFLRTAVEGEPVLCSE